jgi:hypothetical protein
MGIMARRRQAQEAKKKQLEAKKVPSPQAKSEIDTGKKLKKHGGAGGSDSSRKG